MSKTAHVAQLCMSDEEDAGVSYLDPGDASEEPLSAVDASELRYDQFCAYDIITWHLDQTLAGANPPPLRMLIHGEGLEQANPRTFRLRRNILVTGQQDTC